jgi:hypothetical protein
LGYELHWEGRGVVKRYFGQVSGEELLAPVVATEADERFDMLRFVINDFLEAKSVVFTQADIDTIAAHDMGAAATNPYIKVAVVATQPEVIDLVQRYMQAAVRAYPTSIFSTMAEARAWVAAPMAGWTAARQ